MTKFLTLVLIGLSVGLGNFAAAIAIGLSGVNRKLRFRIGLVFGFFETTMPVIGLLIGHNLAGSLGNKANIFGGGLLFLTGLYVLIQAGKSKDSAKPKVNYQKTHKLLLAGLGLSLDNLIVGFSLGTTKESLPITILVIGLTCIVLSLLGLELGGRLKSKIENYSEYLSGVILLLVGVALATKLL